MSSSKRPARHKRYSGEEVGAPVTIRTSRLVSITTLGMMGLADGIHLSLDLLVAQAGQVNFRWRGSLQRGFESSEMLSTFHCPPGGRQSLQASVLLEAQQHGHWLAPSLDDEAFTPVTNAG